MLKSMRKSKNRYFYHIFVSPGDAPGAIMLNVVWMEREFDAEKRIRCLQIVSQHVPIYVQQFPHAVIRTASAKNRRFHVPQPTFLFPLVLAACSLPIYLFRVIRFRVIVSELYDAEVQKSLFLPHFCFPWGRPWRNHAKCCMDGKIIRCLQIISLHVPIYL